MKREVRVAIMILLSLFYIRQTLQSLSKFQHRELNGKFIYVNFQYTPQNNEIVAPFSGRYGMPRLQYAGTCSDTPVHVMLDNCIPIIMYTGFAKNCISGGDTDKIILTFVPRRYSFALHKIGSKL